MELRKAEERPVVIAFTREEARQFRISLMADVEWSRTSAEELYADLYDCLRRGLGN
jgi:hypothetical protein